MKNLQSSLPRGGTHGGEDFPHRLEVHLALRRIFGVGIWSLGFGWERERAREEGKNKRGNGEKQEGAAGKKINLFY